jgi:ubiquinone/menaquinone biosynthesis C-methylase UbiE
MGNTAGYLLANDTVELERLRLQARVWEPEAEKMLDAIGVQPGWNCVDLGCGAMGILGPLSQRVGPEGRVVGIDSDAKQLSAASEYVRSSELMNVELIELDGYRSSLPRESFDLVHVRFVFAPVGRDEDLVKELVSLARPGAVIAVQEPDADSWTCYPRNPAWDELKQAILLAFRKGGGDFNAGKRTISLLQRAGLRDVKIRAAIVALQGEHPYKRLPVQFAASLRARIIDSGIMTADHLDRVIAESERIASNPESVMVSFTVTQVWGMK